MSVPTPPIISVRPRVTPTTLEFWWQPPVSANGTISGYTLSCASPSITQTYGATIRQALITGLTTGTDYTFTLIATNQTGSSNPATYRTVRTSAKPQPVATLTASNTVSGGLLSITFTWTNPGGGDYAYYYVIGLRAAAGTKDYIYRGTRTYTTLTYTIGGLDPTQLYAFHVQRGNDAGYSTQLLVSTTRASYFDPTSIAGLQVWYDAADTAGNGSTVADGTTVATWVDKSGNSRNATAAGGSATLQTDSAGRRLTFNGTTNRYNLPSSSWMYNTPYTVFVADTPSKINNAALIANSNGSADAFAMKYTTGTTIRLAGGYGNARIIYSYDGINWLPSSTDNNYPDAGTTCYVIATNGIICIAGFSITAPAMYSYDGIKWITSSPPRERISALAWNGTIWVAGGVVNPGQSSDISTSPDGIKWTDTQTNIFSDACTAVATNGELFVAGGGAGTNRLAYSYDGVSWIASTSGNAVFTSECLAVAWNGTKWVAGGTGTNQLAYSSDGITWTASASGNAVFTTYCSAVAWNGTKWVAGGSGTNKLAYSSDGETWTAATSPITTAVYTVSWDGTQWIAGGYGTNVLAYSSDGETWAAVSSVNALFTRSYASTALILGPTTYNASVTGAGIDNVSYTLNTAVETTASKTGTRDISGNIWVAGGYGTNRVAYSTDGISWTGSTSGNAIFTTYGLAFASNGSRWVAGGAQTNRIAYSSDGITWTVSASGNAVITNVCQALAWNGTLFVAGGNGDNRLAYSSDGITWTASTSGNGIFTNACQALAWNGTRWVAGGSGDNRLAYSSDGITWTASTSGNGVLTGACQTVAWSGTRFVAGGSGDNRLAYSSDGITWTASTSGNTIFSSICFAVAWNGTRWVAGGEGTNQLAYSSDGITWTASTSGNGVLTGACKAVAWNGTLFVAGGNGDNRLAYSSDGITWTASASGNAVFTTAALALAYGATITQKTVVMPSFVAGGGGTNQLAYSYDGITWTASTSGTAVFTTACQAVATNGSKWVAGGYGTNRLAYSPDGITWNASTSGNTGLSTQCLAVATDGTRWVAGGFGTNRLVYSSDGITWTASTSGNGIFTTQCNVVGWNGTQWVAGGQGTNQLAYSSDGITWTASTSGNSRFSTACFALAWNGSSWVAGGSGTNQLAYSSDGITWTASTSGNAVLTTNCKAVAWNGTLWVAGGAGTNQLAYSYDGINWTGSTSGNAALSTACGALSWNGIVWTAGGSGTNQLAYSYDGITWAASTSGNAIFTTQCSALATSYVQEAAVNILSTTTGAVRNLAWNVGGVNTDAYAIQVRDATLAIGAVQGSTAFYQGGMREILVYTGTLSDTNKEQITDYLYNKWNPPPLTLVPATPIKHGLVQWLDANDLTTLFQDLSGTIPASDTQIVRLWNDKSGNGYHMYNDSSSTAATVTVTTINYTLPGYSKPVPASKDITLFLVLKNNNGPNGQGYPTNFSLWQHNNLSLNGHGESRTTYFTQEHDQFSTRLIYNVGAFCIYAATISKAQIINLQCLDISGTRVRDSVEIDSYYTGLGGPVVLCARKAHGGYIDVGEVIYYNRVLSTTEISSTITYLQNKWGVAAAAAGPNLTDNLQLWLDAADPYTVFQNAGAVTIWKDRSGNGYNATPSGSPTYSDGGVVFNGTSQYFNLPNGALPSGNSPYSYYAVIKPTDLSGVGIIGGGADTATFGQMALEYTKENTFIVAGGTGTNRLAYSLDGINWNVSASGNGVITSTCSAVAWNGTLWVAGGNGGTNNLAYSYDGITWAGSASGNAVITVGCIAVAWNGTLWVAGGEGTNRLAYSSDGINWTGSTSGNDLFSNGCSALAWNGTRWVAGGYGTNQVAYSSDGITWTASTSGNAVFTTSCLAVAWNGTTWVAVGAGTNRLGYSSDGITWNASTSGNGVFTTYCYAVAWNGTRWVAGGAGTNQLAYSSDGITWTASTSGNEVFTSNCFAVAWNGTRWVAGGSGGNRLAYSSDGITWTASTAGNAVFTTLSSALASTRVLPSTTTTPTTFLETTLGPASLPATAFVAAGGPTNNLAYSSDGITWANSISGSALFTNDCNAVAWNGTLWVAGGSGGNQVAYSSDGIIWTASSSGNALFTELCYAVGWDGTRWVAGAQGDNRLAYSSDGITWTASTSGNSVITGKCLAVAWNGTRWVAGGDGGNRVAYSPDGITWTASTSGNAVFTGTCYAVAWNGTRWVAGGEGTNQVAYSPDGITWTASTSGNSVFTERCYAVAWNGTRWVAGGLGDNDLAYSPDGITWTASTSGNEVFDAACAAVAWNGSTWVAGGYGTNRLAYSSDGITWTASTSGNGVLTDSCHAVASTRVLPSTSTTTPTVVPRYAAAQGGPIPLNSLSATTPFLVESLYSPTLTRHFVNAEQFAQNTTTPSHAQLTTNNVLGKTPWNKYMKGRIYEILVYNVQHTQDQRFFVEAYLLNKWRAFAFGPTSTATPPCLWLDSSNTGNLTISGTDITAWNDSSASGVNYTSMFSQAHPQYSYDTVTKKYGVLFGSKGVTSGLGNPTTSPFASTITQVSIFVVARFNNAFTTNTMYSSQSGTSPMRFTAKNGNPIFGITVTAPPENGASSSFSFSSTAVTSPFLFSSVSISNTNTIWVNGTQAYTVSEAISISSGTLVYLGYGVNSPLLSVSQGYNGYIFEYLIYPYGVSSVERQKIEGYLAWKWGIWSSLPGTHPYYLSAP